MVGAKLISEFMNEGGVEKNQLHTQLILSIFCQPLNVSGISKPIIRRYNHMYTTFFLDDCLLSRTVI